MTNKVIQTASRLYSIHLNRNNIKVNNRICKKKCFQVSFKEICRKMNWGSKSLEISNSINSSPQINLTDKKYTISQPTVHRWLSKKPPNPNNNTRKSIESRVDFSSEELSLAKIYWDYAFSESYLLVIYNTLINILRFFILILLITLFYIPIFVYSDKEVLKKINDEEIIIDDGVITINYKNDTTDQSNATSIDINFHQYYSNKDRCFIKTEHINLLVNDTQKQEKPYYYLKPEEDKGRLFAKINVPLFFNDEKNLTKIETIIPAGEEVKFQIDLSDFLPCIAQEERKTTKDMFNYSLNVWEKSEGKKIEKQIHFR